MTTAAQIIASCRYDVSDADSTAYFDPELLDYLNRGIDYLQKWLVRMDHPLIVQTQTITTAGGIAIQALPTGYWQTAYMHVSTSTTPMERIGLQGLVDYPTTTEEEPTKFYTDATNITFRPVPDTVYTIYHYYYKIPTALALSSTMPFNDLFNQMLRQFVSSMAMNRDEYSIEFETGLFQILEKQASDIAIGQLPEMTLDPWA